MTTLDKFWWAVLYYEGTMTREAIVGCRQASIVLLSIAQHWSSMWGGVPLCAPASDLTVHNPPVWASEMRFNWEERQRDVSASWEDMGSCEEGGLSWTEITVHYSNKESPCAAKASGSTCPLAENTQSYRARVHSLIYNQLFIGNTFCSFVAFNFFPSLTTLELLLYDPFPPSLWPIERTGSSCYCTFKTSKYMSDLCKHIVMSSPLTTH